MSRRSHFGQVQRVVNTCRPHASANYISSQAYYSLPQPTRFFPGSTVQEVQFRSPTRAFSNFPSCSNDFADFFSASAVLAGDENLTRAVRGGPIRFTCNALDAIIPSFLQYRGGPQDDSRPFINLLAMHQPLKMLYDSGSQVTIIRKDVFSRLCANAQMSPRRLATNIRLAGANNASFGETQCFLVPFSYQGKKTLFPVVVAPTLSSPAILGDDLIKHFNIQYIPRNSTLVGGVQYNATATATHSAIIPPNDDAVITVSLSERPDPARFHCVLLDAVDGSPVFSTPTLYDLPDADGTVRILVSNFSPAPISVPAGRVVAVADFISSKTALQPLDKRSALKMFSDAVSSGTAGSRPRGPPDMETIEAIKNEVDLSHLPASISSELQKLLFRNWDIFSRDRYDLGRTSAYQHDVLLTSDKILFKKQFRIPQEHVTYIQNHTQELLKLGAIKRSTSRYNAPIFCVPKPKGRGLRVIIDYRDLNRISKPDYYVSKTVDDCIDIIGQAKSTMFSSLDLTSGFHQMPLAESAQHLTAFSVSGMGSFEWTTSPFGLLGCPASFSRLMDIVMQDLKKVICYLDDTLVHSDRVDTHLDSLQKVFDRLRLHNLKLNSSKCEFLKRKIPYLGFMLSPQGITPDVDKIRAIANLPPPQTPRKGLCPSSAWRIIFDATLRVSPSSLRN